MSYLHVNGLDELNRKLGQLKSKNKKEFDKVITDIAIDFSSKASNSAPVLYGDLRGELSIPKKVKDGYEIGSSLPYTRRQHECTWYNHPRGGGPKFLERPFNENKGKYIKRVEEVMKNANK